MAGLVVTAGMHGLWQVLTTARTSREPMSS